MRLLPLLCAFLFPVLAVAQITVSGRVVDAKSGDGLPGVTILQTTTTNGISSDVKGNFTLTVPEKLDSVALSVSSIGYFTQRLRVAAGSIVTLRMALDPKPVPDCYFVPAKFLLSLVSGLRYAPVGASVMLDGSRLIRVPLAAAASYQTDLGRSNVLTLGLGLPSIRRFRFPSLSENLYYQRLRVPAANTSFDSYTGTVDLSVGFIGGVRLPTFVLGTGYARWRPLGTEAAQGCAGYGYTLGLRFNVLPYPFNVYGTVQATHWPGFWQWQGRLTHGLPRRLQAGVALNQLHNYTEASLLLTRSFY